MCMLRPRWSLPTDAALQHGTSNIVSHDDVRGCSRKMSPFLEGGGMTTFVTSFDVFLHTVVHKWSRSGDIPLPHFDDVIYE